MTRSDALFRLALQRAADHLAHTRLWSGAGWSAEETESADHGCGLSLVHTDGRTVTYGLIGVSTRALR